MKRRIMILGCVLAISLTAGPLFAQVRAVGQHGRALDASYQVGAGGRNYAVPNNYAPSSTSIYAATRTRGLSGFRGRASALSGDFQGTLSTDGLSRFERQSVGIQDVMRGPTYDPRSSVYYDPYRRTLDSRAVERAAEYNITPIPGEVSRQLRVAQDLYVDATADYRPMMAEQSMNTMAQALDITTPRTGVMATDETSARLGARDLAEQEGPEMFGVLRSDERAKLADELRKLRDERLGQDDVDGVREGALELQVQPEGARRDSEPIDTSLQGRQQPPPLVQPGEDDDNATEWTSVTRQPGRENLSTASADVFLDVLIALQQRQIAEQAGDEATDETDETPPTMEQRLRGNLSVERTEDNRVIIHRLEGSQASDFNQLMEQGRKALREGRFYRATRRYELAAMIRPRNPLPFVGRGLSAFASGEYYTAAMSFHRALEVFPALMETELDFESLLPVAGFDVDQQTHRLEQWLAEIEARAPVRFLAAFLYQNMGKSELARHHAEQLMDTEAGMDPIFKAYAQYVLTGKKPTELIKDAEDAEKAAPLPPARDEAPSDPGQ